MYKGEDTVLELLRVKGKATIEEISKGTGLNEDSVRRIVESPKGEGYAKVEQRESVHIEPTDELIGYAGNGFPEISVFRKALAGASVADLSPAEKSIGLRWAKVKGLISIEGGKLVACKSGEEAEGIGRALMDAGSGIVSEGSCPDPVLLEEFLERRIASRRAIKSASVEYTGKPVESLGGGFDVNVPGPDAPMGKAHPITRMSDRIRSIMTELGFEEMEGSIVESSFWNFDSLFQPQDHPARELADTFYLDGKSPLPEDRKMVERVKKAHEKGWKYKWDPEEARKRVLRTHTTALSARYLSEGGAKGPRKFFAIGRVFRNEATDYKHLAEFHQVEGIIAYEKATFTDLLGILREFYAKLGFKRIRFRPSFFPYTEPSLEVEVYFEPKGQWMELGGAGIFRPEVSIPLAGTYPVLAWGLSLERPLMMLLDLDDIRTFYRNDLPFLEGSRLDI